jgi:hypothetical protein
MRRLQMIGSATKRHKGVYVIVCAFVLFCGNARAQDDDNWPPLSYLKSDYKAVAVVTHIRIQKAEITSRIGGYENWKINAVVLESFKGKFKKGDAIEYFHGAEAGFKQVFLLNERGPGAEFPYTVLENSTLSYNEDRVRKLRSIKRSSVSKRTRR